MDYDVIYVDEGRNATVNDHRTGGRPGWRPLPSRPAGSAGSRTVVVPPNARPTVITGAASGYYQPSPYYQQPYYQQPTFAPPMSSFASRFGMSSGELIDSAIQILAAIMPLPGAPTAQGETSTDVENLMTYQGALAHHAKRDEQFRTVGNLLVRILK